MENNNVSTSLKQSERLIELGIKPETAHMIWGKISAESDCWSCYNIPYEDVSPVGFLHDHGYKPAWTLGDLIDLLPGCIADISTDGLPAGFQIRHDSIAYVDGVDSFCSPIHVEREIDETLIDVAVKVIEILKEMGLM